MANKKTLICYHEDFGKYGYWTIKYRVIPSFNYLKARSITEKNNIAVKKPLPAPLDLVKKMHDAEYIREVMSTGYFENALISAGSVLTCGESIVKRECDNAFAYVGTAGHHASKESAWGFCFFNDAAIMIEYLRKDYGINRFFIVDIDPHFGDGTRDFFGQDQEVFHLNFQSGAEENIDSHNKNIDFPLPYDIVDNEFLFVIESIVPELIRGFEPEIIIVIFGHDSHCLDYGSFKLSWEVYPKLTKILKRTAEEVCNGKLLFILSGGAVVKVAEQAIYGVICELADIEYKQDRDPEKIEKKEIREELKNMVENLVKKFGFRDLKTF